MTTHNTHNRQAYKPPVGFEPTITAGEWPKIYALDRAATGTGFDWMVVFKIMKIIELSLLTWVI